MILHPGIKFLSLHLFIADGVHLSGAGTDILLADLKNGLCSLQMAGGEPKLTSSMVGKYYGEFELVSTVTYQ